MLSIEKPGLSVIFHDVWVKNMVYHLKHSEHQSQVFNENLAFTAEKPAFFV